MKHTPGPWRYSPQVVPSYGFYIQTEDMSHKNTFIGDVGGGLQQPQEIEANAKLIAAAPELMDMLGELIRAGQEALDYQDGSGKPILQEAIWKAQGIISKLNH